MNQKYIPLYRKYRPKNFREVVGQNHVKDALSNAVSLNKISHAYLFTGPRGTGKTSVARILAKSLNCVQGPAITPCEVCPSCLDITNSIPLDVIEIDAASNRKVEDAQNILEKIQYVPVNGKYKIYIIDEVHMLTNHAFNALLKTLEEPPENVIFILATTEPQKVLETITSRCQRFDFRRITTDDIINHLKNIAKLEKIKIDNDALFIIAKNSAGGMRDSLALLDQVSVLDSSKTITAEDVNKLLGHLSFDMLNTLCGNIIQSKPQDAVEFLEKIYNSGNEPAQILTNLLSYLKNLLIVKNCADNELLVELTQLNNIQIKSLKEQSESIETHQIIFLIEKTAYYIKELKAAANQHLWLEIAAIDLANLAQNTSLLELRERVSKLESKFISAAALPLKETAIPAARQIPKQKPDDAEEIADIEREMKKENRIEIKKQTGERKLSLNNAQDLPMPVSKPLSENNQDLTNIWLELLQNVSSPPTVSLLTEHARLIEITEEKIVIGCEKEVFLKMLSSDAKKKIIMEAGKKIFNKNINVLIKLATPEEIISAFEKKNPVIETAFKKEVLEKENSKEINENSEEDEFIENELSKKKEENIKFSDQVSMVMNLFDGKYIEG